MTEWSRGGFVVEKPVIRRGRCPHRPALGFPFGRAKENGLPRQCEHWLAMTKVGRGRTPPLQPFTVSDTSPCGGPHGARPTERVSYLCVGGGVPDAPTYNENAIENRAGRCGHRPLQSSIGVQPLTCRLAFAAPPPRRGYGHGTGCSGHPYTRRRRRTGGTSPA